jgi:hypothetical protein
MGSGHIRASIHSNLSAISEVILGANYVLALGPTDARNAGRVDDIDIFSNESRDDCLVYLSTVGIKLLASSGSGWSFPRHVHTPALG